MKQLMAFRYSLSFIYLLSGSIISARMSFFQPLEALFFQEYSDIALFDPSVQVYVPDNGKYEFKEFQYPHYQEEKDITFLVYISADNDLRFFATNNIKQMAEQGSNKHANILVHLDIRLTGNQKVTRRYYIEKNRIIHVNSNDPLSQKMDSGDPQTLISCFKWAKDHYPAKRYALILWNHGTGIIDPKTTKTINPSDLFIFNPTLNKLELDRSIGFLDLLQTKKEREQKGICWDNTTGNYLNNEKLNYALNEIVSNILNGKKLNIIGFDACLMSMLEIANMMKKYAHIMIGSQELELGWGWNYAQVLAHLNNEYTNNVDFAQHIVNSYELTYKSITDDYTQSALNLDDISELENTVDVIATLLLQSMLHEDKKTVKSEIKTSRSKHNCTHFDGRYIDLYDFFTNLETRIPQFQFKNFAYEYLKTELISYIKHGKNLILKIAFANKTGANLSKAKGISIYFPDYPEKIVDSSYLNTEFAHNNKWALFLRTYLAA